MIRPRPLFPDKLHVGCPNIGDRERLLARIGETLEQRLLSNDGPHLQEFEAQLAAYLGVKHCIAVCNATVGLEIAIRALGLKGEVIVPSFTFAASVHAIAWQGLTPVFCDIDPATHNLDPEAVERLIGPRTTGILGVHLWGSPCPVDALSDIANRRGLKLLYDAAHALGCAHHGRMIGSFGDAEVFSFHATKFVNAAEGGAIVTADDEFAARLRRLRSFGMENGDVEEVGTNGKMSELSAAMGMTSLESQDAFIARNRENLAAYESALAGARGLRLHTAPSSEPRNYQYVVVEVEPGEAGMSRDQVLAALHDQNVLAKRYFFPGCHRMKPYAAMHAGSRFSLPHTERMCGRLLQLPTGTAVTTEDISKIGDFLTSLTARARRAA